jgi:hypothetical protein
MICGKFAIVRYIYFGLPDISAHGSPGMGSGVAWAVRANKTSLPLTVGYSRVPQVFAHGSCTIANYICDIGYIKLWLAK